MEIEDKDYTMEEIVELVNEQAGEFIINIRLEEAKDDEHKGSV